MGIKKARAKEVKRIDAAELGVEFESLATIERLYVPERARQAQILEGEPDEAARRLVEKLKHEARAL
jgi:electron transfer flavoprotein beta subunit